MSRCRHTEQFLLINLVGLYQKTHEADLDNDEDQVATTGASTSLGVDSPRPPGASTSPGQRAEGPGPPPAATAS